MIAMMNLSLTLDRKRRVNACQTKYRQINNAIVSIEDHRFNHWGIDTIQSRCYSYETFVVVGLQPLFDTAVIDQAPSFSTSTSIKLFSASEAY